MKNHRVCEIIIADGREEDCYEFEFVGKIIRTLLPAVGKPNYVCDHHDGLGSRSIGWKFEEIDDFVKAALAIKEAGIKISSEKTLRMKMLVKGDLYPTSFYDSDDPLRWKETNDKKRQQVANNRKIREVTRRLDKK